MDVRFAAVVSSLDDLIDKLSRYTQGESPLPDLHTGDAKTNGPK